MREARDLKIFSGSSHPDLAAAIANHLEIPLGQVRISRFQSGEIYVRYEESIRGTDVFIVQSFSYPINENFVELMIMVDAAKRASAKSITAVIPYYGYARQEKKDSPREPISAKMVADVLTTVGVDRVVTIDLHAPAIQGFFNIPVDHLTALDLICDYIHSKNLPNMVIVSPDAGRAKMAEKLATALGAPFAIMVKNRPAHNVSTITHVIGEVEGRTPVIIEDMIDTGGTIINVVEGLREKGAQEAYVCATHALLSGNSLERLEHPWIREVVVTDTLSLSSASSDRLVLLTVAPLLAKSILLIEEGGSVSSLFRIRKA